MNLLKRFFIRTFQKILYIATFFMPFKEPILIRGKDSFVSLAKLLDSFKKKSVFIVTDNYLHSINMDKLVYDELEKVNIKYSLYYQINANPTIEQVELGVKQYIENKCDSIIVIGGGSAIDAAKVIGARVSNIRKNINKMKGLLKVSKKLPLLVAIPTTAGTGSEATLAAVISNPETKEKFPIEDCKLIPLYAILNPSLLINLPPHVTSTTGMDALTHAIEAYIGNSNTSKTKEYAINAIQLMHKYLPLSYNEPKNLFYREKTQIASYYAGVSFTRAYVGYVHAIAHTLGGFYHIPHGLANAVILPIVLEEYKEKAYRKLAELYDCLHIDEKISEAEKAKRYIEEIKYLNKQLNIENNFFKLIKDEDIDLMVDRAYKEAIPLYPTPELWDKDKFKKIFKILQNK